MKEKLVFRCLTFRYPGIGFSDFLSLFVEFVPGG